MTGGVHDALVVVEHEHELVLDQAQVARQERQHGSKDVGLRHVQGELRSALELGSTARRASTILVQRRTGSLSDGSSESDANGRCSIARHWFSRVVLPNPGGADRSTSSCDPPGASGSGARGRRSGERRPARQEPRASRRFAAPRSRRRVPRGDAAHPCLADFARSGAERRPDAGVRSDTRTKQNWALAAQ